jgi:hypothetical protein
MSDRNQMRVLFEGSSSDRRSSQNFDVIGQAVSEIFTAYGGIFFSPFLQLSSTWTSCFIGELKLSIL